MSEELAIIKQENISTIVATVPQAYSENKVSHDNCLNFGMSILKQIEAEGMTDELDQKAAEYLVRSRKTVTKMNDKRAPTTKFFDDARSVFTQLENEVDPAKKGSIPWQIQQKRNEYAAKKHEEAERKRQAEERERQRRTALDVYCSDCKNEYRQEFNKVVNRALNDLMAINASVSLENYDACCQAIRNFPVELEIFAPQCSVMIPLVLSPDDAKSIRAAALAELLPVFREQYNFELESNRDSILSKLPSKKTELEQIARADAEEARRRKAEMLARDAEDAKALDDARKEKQEQEKKRDEMQRQAAEMDGLFGAAQAAQPEYVPKTSVTKKLVPLDAEAFMPIISMWWAHEGKNMSVAELSKIFKKQLTFCEKKANDKTNPTTIQSEHLRYEDAVKAR